MQPIPCDVKSFIIDLIGRPDGSPPGPRLDSLGPRPVPILSQNHLTSNHFSLSRLPSIPIASCAVLSGTLPRIPLEEMDIELAEYLGPRVTRLGYLGEFFQCAAHQPRALLAFQAYTDAAKSGLSDRLTETVALTAAQVMGNRYER